LPFYRLVLLLILFCFTVALSLSVFALISVTVPTKLLQISHLLFGNVCIFRACNLLLVSKKSRKSVKHFFFILKQL
jgi:hypothetical protein